MTTPTRNILVYTDGEVLGDGVLRLIFAAALKRATPELSLTWLASNYSAYDTVLRAMAAPLIDHLLILPKRRMHPVDYLLRPAVLRHQSFDLIIDSQRNVKRTFWLKRIRHRHFISAAANGLFSSHRLPPLSPHFLQRLLQLGEAGLGRSLTIQPLPLPPGDWERDAMALLPDGARYVGFVIGAGSPDKCWPLEQFIRLAQAVAARGDVPVIFLGPKEAVFRERIEAALPEAILPLSTTGQTSPYLSIALGKRLVAAVANDSGGGHLLAVAGTPLVSLFRAASVRAKFLPQTSQVVALAPEDFGVPCLQDIPLSAVQQALNSLTLAA